MKAIKILLILCFSIGQGLQQSATAQTDTTKYVRIILQNGGVFEGELIEIDESSFLIDTELLGHMRIDKTTILTVVYIQEDEVGLVVYKDRTGDINPQSSRYFFAPSAIPLKKGEGYFQNAYLIYNQVSYGISDNFTAGLTMTIFGTGGSFKFGGKIDDKFYASVGAIGIIPFWGGDITGIAFANITIGDERTNASISFGMPFDGEPIINFSAMKELNRYTWLMTENYVFLGDNYSFYSIGVRRASERRDVLRDYAMVIFPDLGVLLPIPWFSVTIPF